MVIYGSLFVLFYAIGAYFSVNAIAYHIMFDNPKHFIEIIYMYGVLFALLAGHALLYRYGKRKGYIAKSLIIILCGIDIAAFGLILLTVTFFVLDGGLLNYFKTLFRISVPASAYWLLVIMAFHRIWVTKRFLSHNKTG